MVIMVSALHLSVFLLIATLAATPSYYVMRRTREGRARESISYLLGLAVGIAAACFLSTPDNPTLGAGLLGAFVGPWLGMARAGYMRLRKERNERRKARIRAQQGF